MIPYGLYVMTAEDKDGRISAAIVNWVTQASFKPPLVAVSVKADSQIYDIVKTAGNFALNVLGKRQHGTAYAFFKPAERERDGQKISYKPFRAGSTGAPVLENTPAFVVCRLVTTVEEGDHSIFVGKVVDAGVTQEPEGRADEVTLLLKELREKTFLQRLIGKIL